MNSHFTLIPIILSGGAGTRLWPVSRESHPKPFMVLPDKQSLLQKTFMRASLLPNVAEIMTLTNKEYYLKSKSSYDEVKNITSPPLRFLLEPSARNTAPAILLAALQIQAQFGDDAILLVLPADHLINQVDAFVHDCEHAIEIALQNKLVTFGIQPTKPETGFGYIEVDGIFSEQQHAYHVKRFVEKPSKDVAETYVASNQYLWNSGMFCFRAGTFLEQFELHAPSLLKQAKNCFQKTLEKNTTNIQEIDEASFNMLENISIDYALMEKSQEIAVIRAIFDWQDIGSWNAYKALLNADEQGNTVVGHAILIDSHNNFIQSENRMIASIGVNNLAIVDTPDALLITHRDRSQDVKEVVSLLKDKAHESYLTHRTVIRPWGSYTILEEGTHFKIKRIEVSPKARLSLQTHAKRSEHWVVVSGTATVQNNDKTYELKTNESTFVPIGIPHRLANLTDQPLIIIEVQTGEYLGEDDITRLEDHYGRVT